MSFTNAQLVRTKAGDAGRWARDVASGDGTSTTFYVSATPVIGDSQTVTVGGALRTEVPSSPGGTQYTFDDEQGLITFGSAPDLGTDNVVIAYKACRITDAEIDEACRIFSLDPDAVADVGPAAGIYSAVVWLCEMMAAATAGDFDFETDGQSYKKGSVSAAWAARAEMNRAIAARTVGGIVSVPVTKLDGYARRGEFTTRDLGDTTANPRRRFYGEEDVLP